jgi:hypothetical protein
MPTASNGNHANRRKQEARKRKRRNATRDADGLQHQVRRKAAKSHVLSSNPVKTKLRTEGLPTSSTGFVGKRQKELEDQPAEHMSLEDLFPEGKDSEYLLIEYEPKYVFSNVSYIPILR